MNRKVIYIITAVVVVIALVIAGAVVYTNSKDYVATVGGEKITKTEYNFFLSMAKYQINTTLNTKISDWNVKIGNDKAGDLAKNMALDNAIQFKIELKEAKKAKMALSTQDMDTVNSTIDSLKQQYGSTTEAETAIKNNLGITLAQYKNIIKDLQLTYKYKDAEMKKIQPSEDETKKFYDANKDRIDYVTVRHILISGKDAEGKELSADKLKEAEKTANDVLAKVNAGEDFTALAKQYSEDPGSKDSGGEYSFTKAESAGYAKEFQEWAWANEVGKTGVVKTDFGYHVMKLEVKKNTYDDGKNIAKNGVINETYGKKIENLKKDASYVVAKNEKNLSAIIVK